MKVQSPQLLLLAVFVALVAAPTGRLWAHAGDAWSLRRLTARLRADPDRGDLWVRRAALNRRRGDLRAAYSDLRRGLQFAPALPDLSLELGRVCAKLGLDRDAVHAFDIYLRTEGKRRSIALRERARALLRLRRPGAALRDYDALLETRGSPRVYLERGHLLRSLGRLADAATGYRHGLGVLGDSVVLRAALVEIESERGAFSAALEAIEPLVRRAPVKTRWLLRRARIHRAAGNPRAERRDLEAALRAANEVLRRRPSTLHLVARARVLLALGRPALARRDLRSVLARSPSSASARRLMSQLQQGRPR